MLQCFVRELLSSGLVTNCVDVVRGGRELVDYNNTRRLLSWEWNKEYQVIKSCGDREWVVVLGWGSNYCTRMQQMGLH